MWRNSWQKCLLFGVFEKDNILSSEYNTVKYSVPPEIAKDSGVLFTYNSPTIVLSSIICL